MIPLVGGLHNIINALLPFTRPGTPLLQDVVHTIAICAILYYLPQLAEWQQRRQKLVDRETSHRPLGVEQEQHDHDGIGEGVTDEISDAGLAGEHEAADEPPAVDAAPGLRDTNDMIQPDAVPDLVPGPQQQQQQQQGRRPRDHGNVGAKKARSLARREQRRAYHEFVRNQADQQRAADASTADAREAALSAERERRAEAERRLDAQRDVERRSAKAERTAREQRERERRATCEEILKERLREEGAVDLMEVAEELFIDDVFALKLSDAEADKVWHEKLVWVERLARAIPGLLGKRVIDREVVITMLTASRWIVRVDREVMDAAYKRAEVLARERMKAGDRGRIDMKEFGHVLEDVLMVSANG